MAEMTSMSRGQRNYLRKLRRDSQIVRIIRILIFLAFLALWEGSARLGLIDSFIFSSPSQVVMAMYHMILDGTLAVHTGVTLWETIASFALVTVFGIAIAVLLWCFPKLSSILEPYLVVAGLSVAIFGAILNLYTGFCGTDPDKLKLISTLRGTKKDALFKVVLPSSVPLILSIMKVNIGLCLIGVVIGEMIGSKRGLGYLIIYSSQVFKLDTMIMSIVILCIIAAVLYSLINVAEKKYRKHF